MNEIDEMLSHCEDHESRLTEWECNFIEALADQWGDKSFITDQQTEKLTSIYEGL